MISEEKWDDALDTFESTHFSNIDNSLFLVYFIQISHVYFSKYESENKKNFQSFRM